jgi:hypothetical protein
MAASYLCREMNEAAVFELFVRHLPAHRDWLLAAGLGPRCRSSRLRFRRRRPPRRRLAAGGQAVS